MTNTNLEDREVKTIGMLLDIEHIYGGHESRLGPLLTVLLISGAPPLLYVYLTAWTFMPLWVFVPIWLIITLRTVMIVLGKEKERKEKFKKQLYSDYSEPAQLLNIKTIHPDGCIEYINGTICYLVLCYNGTVDDEEQRSIQLRKLLANMIGDFDYDTYLLNIDDAPALKAYYDRISNFDKSEAAVNFVRIIDHTVQLVQDQSNVICTVYAIKGHRSDWKVMANQIDTSIKSRLARCYKSITRVADETAINEIINRDADTVINIPELLRKKYATDQFASSKVLAYDLPDADEIIQGAAESASIIPESTSHSFHKVYTENKEGK